MAKESSSGNDRINSNGGNEMNTFQKHNGLMQDFRKAHANVALVNEPRLDDSAMIGGMEPLQISHIVDETGGSINLDGTWFQFGLIPMAEIKQYKLSCN